jgi:hypothetical protein
VSALTLSNHSTLAEIVPGEGARVQHLIDLASSRELLYQRKPPPGPRLEFMPGCPGGWDEMFPNDTPWAGHPDHGRIWSLPFDIVETALGRARLRARLDEPHVLVERRIALLAPPRRGVRIETELQAIGHTGPFLWASHPMLAVRPGWTIEVDAAGLVADDDAPGRFSAGRRLDSAPPVPAAGKGWSEVLYTTGGTEAATASPDGRSRTRMAWHTGFLKHLWIVTVTGAFDLDLCLLFEPCTTRPDRLDEAIAVGEAASLAAGETVRWWTELESLDLTAIA